MKMKRSSRNQIVSGLRLAGLIVLAFVTAVLLVWGSVTVTGKTGGSVVLGWAALAAGLAILVLNLDGWAKMLPGFLALAALNALVMAASGHVLNDPSTPVSRSMAFGSAIALAFGSLLSSRFYGKRLAMLDRVVLVAYVGFMLLGFVTGWALISFSLGTLVLAIPWVNSRIRNSDQTMDG